MFLKEFARTADRAAGPYSRYESGYVSIGRIQDFRSGGTVVDLRIFRIVELAWNEGVTSIF